MFTLTKAFTFEAAHKLEGHDGKCARLHGHSWRGRLIVCGTRLCMAGPKRNMLCDYAKLTELLSPLIGEHLDHHYLNDALGERNPTSEFVAWWLYNKLHVLYQPEGDAVRLLAVEIDETCTSSCRYEG